MATAERERTAPSAASAPPRRDDGRLVRGRLMAQSLMLVLNRVPGARDVLPHLAALERGLIERGTDAIHRIPPHWLSKICSQLSSLPLPDDDAPLQDLLERLLAEHRRHRQASSMGGYFDAERTVVIREITHSDFMAATAEQATTIHGDAT